MTTQHKATQKTWRNMLLQIYRRERYGPHQADRYFPVAAATPVGGAAVEDLDAVTPAESNYTK